jgi:ADP-dependent NAD(P)H-hydrate dehydratase / NAD(P)H-hydrate epimerase
MRLLNGQEMQELERLAARRQGLTREELMQRAAEAVAEEAARLAPAGPVAVVAGKGDNGGDGRIAAALLEERGVEVRLVDLTDETTVAELGPRLESALDGAELIVDAVFGFSLHAAPRPPAADAIAAIDIAAAAGTPVLSVDVPSGIEAHSGHAHGPAVHAAETLTFTAPKLGLALEPGRSHAGDVIVVDIGVGEDLVEDSGQAYMPEMAQIAALLPRRPVDAHKRQCGAVLVIAGSQGMTGSATLAAMAALESGAGVVQVAVPESLVPVMETKLTEQIVVGLAETFGRSIDAAATETVIDLASRFDVVAIGPGLSLDDSTVAFVRGLVPALDRPLVIDADALNALVGSTELLAGRKAPTVITPHPGEMARLTKSETADVQHDRPGFARTAAKEFKAVTVLKGAPTLVSDGQGIAVNPTGNPGMATMGAGDVLTGLVAGFMAQGLEPSDAAVLGAWVHGACGDVAAGRVTEYCLVASDILAALPEVLRDLMELEGGIGDTSGP